MNSGKKNDSGEWMSCNTQAFWGEIAPHEHIVQIYEDKSVFLNLLEGYVLDGFDEGDCVIIIATNEHLKALHKRLKKKGCNLSALVSDDQYIPLQADATLDTFMKNGWPDEILFAATIECIVRKAKARSRRIRVFGEMVELLWAQRHSGAAIKLDHLWNHFCEMESFCLFCAYPKKGFTKNMNDYLQSTCSSHSKVILGTRMSPLEVFYKVIDSKKKPD